MPDWTFMTLKDLASETGVDVEHLVATANRVFWRTKSGHSALSRFTPAEIQKICSAASIDPPSPLETGPEPDEQVQATTITSNKEESSMSTNTPPHPVHEPEKFADYCRDEFLANADLQREFRTPERYTAYRAKFGWSDDGRQAGGVS